MSKYRKKMLDRKSQRLFTRAARVHPKNVQSRPMRGGIRL